MTAGSEPEGSELTRLLKASSFDLTQNDRLAELVYSELHTIASRLMRGERQDHTMQPTALVNEALMGLIKGTPIDPVDSNHLRSIAARKMRLVLVDCARKRRAIKRGDGGRAVTLGTSAGYVEPDVDIIELNEALERMQAVDPRAADVIELHLFGGLTQGETANELEVSERTIRNDLSWGKAWLRRELAR